MSTLIKFFKIHQWLRAFKPIAVALTPFDKLAYSLVWDRETYALAYVLRKIAVDAIVSDKLGRPQEQQLTYGLHVLTASAERIPKEPVTFTSSKMIALYALDATNHIIAIKECFFKHARKKGELGISLDEYRSVRAHLARLNLDLKLLNINSPWYLRCLSTSAIRRAVEVMKAVGEGSYTPDMFTDDDNELVTLVEEARDKEYEKKILKQSEGSFDA